MILEIYLTVSSVLNLPFFLMSHTKLYSANISINIKLCSYVGESLYACQVLKGLPFTVVKKKEYKGVTKRETELVFVYKI